MFAEVPLELIDDVSIAHEGEGVVVDPNVHPKLDVSPVFVCDGRQVCTLSPDIQMPPAHIDCIRSSAYLWLMLTCCFMLFQVQSSRNAQTADNSSKWECNDAGRKVRDLHRPPKEAAGQREGSGRAALMLAQHSPELRVP